MIKFCDKKLGNNCRCSNVATTKSVFVNRDTSETKVKYRCDLHERTSTSNFNFVVSEAYCQKGLEEDIRKALRKYIGKRVISSFHRNAWRLYGSYVKGVGIMCQEFDGPKRYKFVYYHQIKDFSI